jgi:hypothetical protein
MRIPCPIAAVLIAAVLGLGACGDPVRRGDAYFGEAFVRFAARLTGPVAGFQKGDRLQPWWQTTDGLGGGADPSDGFEPRSFPHDFIVDVTFPPRATIGGQDPAADPADFWYIEVTGAGSHDPLGETGKAASLNHWIGHSQGPVQVFPVGAQGPSLDLPGGYVLISRTCSPGQLNQLAIVPSTEVIVVQPLSHPSAEEAYLARCGGR